MKRKHIALFSVLTLLSAVLPLHAEAPQTPIVVLEIRGVSQLSDTVRDVAEPWEFPFQKEMITGALAGAFGISSLDGLDHSGTIQLVLFAEGILAGSPSLRLTLPVEPGNDALRTALEDTWIEDTSTSTDELRRFTRPTDRHIHIPLQELYLKEDGNHLLLASQPSALLAGRPTLLADVQGTLALAVMPERIAKLYAPILEQQTEAMRAMMEAMPEEERGDVDFESMQAGQQMMISLLSQIQMTGLGLRLEEGLLTINTALQGATDSIVSELLNTMRTPSDTFLRLIPANAVLASSGHITIPDSLLDAYLELITPLMEATPEQAHLLPMIKSSFDIMKGQYGGDYAMAFLPVSENEADTFGFVQASRIVDIARMKEAMDEYLEVTTAAMQELAPDRDLFQIKDPRTYRDTEIIGYNMDTAMGVPETEEALRQLMPHMLSMNAEYAFVGDIMISAIGSSKGMDEMIDRVLDGGPSLKDTAAIRRHFPDLPANFVDLTVVQPVALIRAFGRMIPIVPTEWTESLEDDLAAVAAYTVVDGSTAYALARVNFNDLARLIQSVPERGKTESSMDESQAADVGDEAPDFELTLLDGEVFRLSDHRGKTVLIDFWATWCPPCVESLPYLQSMYEEFGGEDVIFIGVSLDRPAAEGQVKRMLDRFGTTYLIGISPDTTIAAAYAAHSIPTLVVVDPEGIIRHRKVGFTRAGMEEVKGALSELAGRD